MGQPPLYRELGQILSLNSCELSYKLYEGHDQGKDSGFVRKF